MTIWEPSSNEQLQLINQFKKIFINQEHENLNLIFDNNFGIHNGLSQQEYAKYEFDEFFLKCDKFQLTMDADVVCYNIGNDFIYFSLGKKDDKAVFESIFQWNPLSNKLKGNQYHFKIKPKIQFKKDNNTNQIIYNRRINIKPPNNNILIKQVFSTHPSYDFQFMRNMLEEHLGGNFYSISYLDEINNSTTYWNDIIISSNLGKFKNKILMRGINHPLFINDLFPILINQNSFQLKENIYPVIINVIFLDNTQEYFKYPTQKTFSFLKPIKQVCLTDTLSFDWILDI